MLARDPVDPSDRHPAAGQAEPGPRRANHSMWSERDALRGSPGTAAPEANMKRTVVAVSWWRSRWRRVRRRWGVATVARDGGPGSGLQRIGPGDSVGGFELRNDGGGDARPRRVHGRPGRYDAQVRPLLEHMRSGSGAMDQQMSSMGRAADADMTCGTEAMTAELDLHASIACASPTDMGPNESEAGTARPGDDGVGRPPARPRRADGLVDGHGRDAGRDHDRDVSAERGRCAHDDERPRAGPR